VNEASRRPGRRQQQAEWRREQLLDAALSVFGRRGIEGASTREVAAAAGVTPGLLYHYFATKEELALAVIAERGFLPELREILRESATEPSAVVLSRLVSACAELMSRRGDLVAMAISGAIGNPRIRHGLHELIAEGQRLLVEYLAEGVARGELREHDSEVVAQMMVAPIVLGQIGAPAPDPAAVSAMLIDYLVLPA
jgi:AcrR family transcriptional regulator